MEYHSNIISIKSLAWNITRIRHRPHVSLAEYHSNTHQNQCRSNAKITFIITITHTRRLYHLAHGISLEIISIERFHFSNTNTRHRRHDALKCYENSNTTIFKLQEYHSKINVVRMRTFIISLTFDTRQTPTLAHGISLENQRSNPNSIDILSDVRENTFILGYAIDRHLTLTQVLKRSGKEQLRKVMPSFWVLTRIWMPQTERSLWQRISYRNPMT